MWLESVLEEDTPNIIKPFYGSAQNILLLQNNYESTTLHLKKNEMKEPNDWMVLAKEVKRECTLICLAPYGGIVEFQSSINFREN